jgi:DNA-directed RNA polymerase subunit RPC12/RpoP
MKCPACGATFKAEVVDGRVTCTNCGRKLKVAVKGDTPQKKEAPVKEKEETPKVAAPVAKKQPAPKPEPKKVVDDFDDEDEFGDAFDDMDEFDEAPAKKSAKKPAKKPEPIYDDDDDEFDDEDDDDFGRSSKSYDDEDDDEFDDEDDDDEYDEKPAKKNKSSNNGGGAYVDDSNVMKIKDYLIVTLLALVPCVSIILYILIAVGTLFKDKPGYKYYARFQLLIMAIAMALVIIFSIIAGTATVSVVNNL